MEKYFKRKATDQLSPPPRTDALNHGTAKRQCEEINLANLPSYPGLRTRILDYNPTVQDQVRRAYLQRGPCQPKQHNFPQTNFSNTIRRFNPAWFDEYASWLEYSIEKDVAYCLYSYIFKRHDFLREKQPSKIIEALDSGEISSGRGLNQEITIKRAGETRWSFHYGTLISIINLFPSIIELLEELKVNASKIDQKHEATKLLDWLESFDFAFSLHLMKNLLGITHQLSQALQRRYQDIVNAMNLVTLSKQQLQEMRDSGWDSLLNQIVVFCDKYDIDVPNMDDIYLPSGRS